MLRYIRSRGHWSEDGEGAAHFHYKPGDFVFLNHINASFCKERQHNFKLWNYSKFLYPQPLRERGKETENLQSLRKYAASGPGSMLSCSVV